MTGTRPGTVTFAFVILLVVAIFQLVNSIIALVFLIIGSTAADGVSVEVGAALWATVIVLLVVSLVQLLLAFGVNRGSNVARVIVLILSILNLGLQVLNLAQQWGQGPQWQSWVGLVLNLLVIVLLLTRSANRYYAR